jgi:hypothetical protein
MNTASHSFVPGQERKPQVTGNAEDEVDELKKLCREQGALA